MILYSFKVSLILATYGRLSEVLEFCESLNSQDCDLGAIELIVIDQNEAPLIENALKNKKLNYEVVYIYTTQKGLSQARNLGLKVARGAVIGYPDDDCAYYSNTISEVLRQFNDGDEQKLIIGQIIDKKTGKKIIKKWPNKNKSVNFYNYYKFSNSITLFHSASLILSFDCEMGAGKYYGSYEDVDFIYRWLAKGKIVTYASSIEVWHPEFDPKNISLVKVRSYARGLGYFIIKKHDIPWPKYVHFSILVFYKILQLLLNLFIRKKFKKGYFAEYYRGLIEGLKACKL